MNDQIESFNVIFINKIRKGRAREHERTRTSTHDSILRDLTRLPKERGIDIRRSTQDDDGGEEEEEKNKIEIGFFSESVDHV